MNSEIKKLCRELKGRGWKIDEISSELGIGYQTVSKHTRGINDLRYRTSNEAIGVVVDNNNQRKDSDRAEDNIQHTVDTVESNQHKYPYNYGLNMHKYGINKHKYAGNYTTETRKKTNNGGNIVVGFVIILLVIFLLDHFAFEGKLLAYIRSYFYEEEIKEISQEQPPEPRGFEGRNIEDL